MMQPMMNSAPVLFDDDVVSSTIIPTVPTFTDKNVDEHTVAQALLTVHRFLKQTKCDETAEKLKEEIDKKRLIPGRLDPFDSQGNNYLESSFDQYQRTHENVVDFLPVIHRLNQYAQKDFPLTNSISRIRLTNNAPNLSLTRKTNITSNKPVIATSFHPSDIENMRTTDLIKAVRFGRTVCSESMVSRELKTSIRYYTRVMGHVSPVYCVTFDRTGDYVITGADDNLIKVWDIRECLLRFTFRGHYGELTDLSVSHDNCYLASGSNDKTVRIWSLQDGRVVDVMMHHKGPISSVAFLPFFEGNVRYLTTASYDCSIFFYRYDADTFRQLGSDHFPHKDGGPGKIVTSATSAGGKFAAFSDTRKNIFIYKLSIDGVELVEALQNTHNDKVDSLAFAFTQLRLLSSSADGILKFWDYKCKKWRATEAKLPDELLPKQTLPILNGPGLKKNKYGVLTISWSTDDKFAISTGTDHVIRIWDPITATLIKSLTGHERTIFLIRPHPTDPMFFITGSHDGQVMLWDLRDFSLVRKFKNDSHAFDDKSDSVLDFSFSPNGLFSAFVDEAGCVTFMGISKNDQLKLVPKQQFFHSDYMPCANDEQNLTTDLTTNLAPHLNNPPILIQMENIPHEDKWQRKVPGRAKMLDAPEGVYPEGHFCAWKYLDIAPKLEEYQQEKIKREHTFYGLDLFKAFEIENSKEPPENWDQNDKPKKAVKRTVRRNLDTLPPPIIILADTDSDDMTYSEGSVESRSPSEDELPDENNPENEDVDENDSDYYEGYQGPDTVFRNHNRRRRRRDEDGNQNEVESPPLPRENERPVGRPRRVRRERIQDDSQPGPSRPRANANSARRSTRANPVPDEEDEPRNRRGRRRIQREREQPDSQNQLRVQNDEEEERIESPPERSPSNRRRAVYPTWTVEFKRRRFPFVAQLGDRIVYFPQGHLLYLNKCQQLKLFKNARDFRPRAEFNSQEFAIVDNVQYLIKPYRCTELTLGLTDVNDVRTGRKFVVRYHDLQDFPDFMVHRYFYDTSVSLSFQEGDQVEAIIDDKWWTGRVEKRKYDDQGEYNNSQFNSVVVKWSNEEHAETCSPWELQKLSNGRQNETPVTEDEQDEFGNVPPRIEDWPLPDEAFPADDGRVSGTRARDYFCEKLRNALNSLTSVEALAVFEYPVDLSKYDNYYDCIAYPMDLQTLNERLCNSYYRTLQHLKCHIQLLAKNAETYNEETSIIANNSKALVETLFRVLENTQTENAMDLFETLRREPANALTAWKRELGYKQSRGGRRSGQSGDVAMDEPITRNISNRNEPIWVEESIAACNQEIEQSLKEAIGENELADIIQQLRIGIFEGPEDFLHHLIQQIEYAVSHSEDRRSSRQLNLLITKLNRRFANIKDKYNRMVRERTTRGMRNSSMSLRENRRTNQLRRSSRRHGEVNYAELANGTNFIDEEPAHRSGRPTRNSRKSKSVERKPSLKSESEEDEENFEEENYEIPPQPMAVDLFEDDNPSTPSNEGQDSDYQEVEEQEEPESENEVDIAIDPDDKPSSESESTAKSTSNSSRSSPASRRQSAKRTRKRPKRYSDAESEENQPKSKRRKQVGKKKATTSAPKNQTGTIAATRTRRQNARTVNYADVDDDDDLPQPRRQAARTINYAEDDDEEDFPQPRRQSGRRLAPRN